MEEMIINYNFGRI